MTSKLHLGSLLVCSLLFSGCGSLHTAVSAQAQGEAAAPTRAAALVQEDSLRSTDRKFPFVGAALSDYPRLTRVPGRRFDDFAGKPTDVPSFLAANGFNAVRVVVNASMPPTTPAIDNSDIDHREANYQLDFGGLDWQVAVAKRAHTLGQRVAVTLQFGQENPAMGDDNWHEYIPADWLGLSYAQTLDKIDSNTRRMVHAFLQAGVQPDILIIENESDSGILFQTVGADGKMVQRNDKTSDPFSDAATGNFTIWPKCAGYYKREILSAKDEIKREGYDPARTRIAVHGSTSPGHTRFMFDNIFHNKPDADSVYYQGDTPKGVVTAVPAYLRNLHLADMIDIMGFSFYPIPPTNGSKAAFDTSLRQMTDDLAYFNTILPAYGRYSSGPFIGQNKKESMVIEFGVPTDASVGFDVAREDKFVTAFFDALAVYPWTLGAMWWEPEYARNNWSHGEASLYRTVKLDPVRNDWPVFTPIDTIKTWGSFAAPRKTTH